MILKIGESNWEVREIREVIEVIEVIEAYSFLFFTVNYILPTVN